METKQKKHYNELEILNCFESDESLDSGFKSEVLRKVNAIFHVMAMCLEKDKKTCMTMVNEHGDKWYKEYNQIVSLYQAYHS